jgi:hypothetical protein
MASRLQTCPSCGESVADGAAVCRHCLFVIDREHWQHDAGRLGADDRGAGHPLEDPSVGPIPLTGEQVGGGGLVGSVQGLLSSIVRLAAVVRLVGRRRR